MASVCMGATVAPLVLASTRRVVISTSKEDPMATLRWLGMTIALTVIAACSGDEASSTGAASESGSGASSASSSATSAGGSGTGASTSGTGAGGSSNGGSSHGGSSNGGSSNGGSSNGGSSNGGHSNGGNGEGGVAGDGGTGCAEPNGQPCASGLECCSGVPYPPEGICHPDCPLVSDRAQKYGFQSIDPEQTLERLSALPITEWSYKRDGAEIRHIGPMAQDFRSAFGLGD